MSLNVWSRIFLGILCRPNLSGMGGGALLWWGSSVMGVPPWWSWRFPVNADELLFSDFVTNLFVTKWGRKIWVYFSLKGWSWRSIIHGCQLPQKNHFDFKFKTIKSPRISGNVAWFFSLGNASLWVDGKWMIQNIENCVLKNWSHFYWVLETWG